MCHPYRARVAGDRPWKLLSEIALSAEPEPARVAIDQVGALMRASDLPDQHIAQVGTALAQSLANAHARQLPCVVRVLLSAASGPSPGAPGRGFFILESQVPAAGGAARLLIQVFLYQEPAQSDGRPS